MTTPTQPPDGAGGGQQARGVVAHDRATLDFIRDRVLAEIRANPSVRPFLGEEERHPTRVKTALSETEREQRRQQRAEYKRRWRQQRQESRP